MPLAAMKKASVFMTADYSEIAVPFLRSVFAQRLIIGRPALSAHCSVGLIRLLSVGLESSKIGRWQFMSYAV